MKELTEAEFKATLGDPMKQLPVDASPPFDFWDYFHGIPLADFQGYDCSEGTVTYAWEHPEGGIQHVLVDSNDPNVFMVLVIDCRTHQVVGHRLLNLSREYGLEVT